MINGEKADLTMLTALKKLQQIGKDALGDVYVKYLEPINLHEYLQAHVPATTELYSAKTFEKTAIGLTTHIYKRQYQDSPVTLNSLLASWLLQEN